MTDPVHEPEDTYSGTISTVDGKIASVMVVTQSLPPEPIPPPIPELPDLIVTSVRVVSPPPGPDGKWKTSDPLLIGATVKNVGERILPGVIIGVANAFGPPDPSVIPPNSSVLPCWTWSDSYTDGLDTDQSIECIANGGFNGKTFPAVGPTLKIEARVDDPTDMSRIVEANETNNRLSIMIDVADPVTPPIPPVPGKRASAQLTTGDFPTDGPQAPTWLGNFMRPLQADGQRKAPAIAQNIGAASASEFMSRAWGIASDDPQYGQNWLRNGQRVAVTIGPAFPPAGVSYGAVTNAQKRQALLDTAAGKNDATLIQAAAYLKAAIPNAGSLVDSRINHEPDATWYVWSIAGGIDAYQAATRYVIPLWKSLLPGTRICANMDGAANRNMAWAPVKYGTGQSQAELIYGPMKSLYDMVAADVYYDSAQGKDAAFADVEGKMDFLLAWSNDWKLPCCVPEWGLNGVDWPDAIPHFRKQIEKFADGQFLYHCYFDGWEPAALRNKPNAKNAFYSLQGFAT